MNFFKTLIKNIIIPTHLSTMMSLIYLEKQIFQTIQDTTIIPTEDILRIIEFLGYGYFHNKLQRHPKVLFPRPSSYIVTRMNLKEGVRYNKFLDFYKDNRIYVCYFCNISLPSKERKKHLQSKEHIQNCMTLETMTTQPYSNYNKIRLYEGNYFFITPTYNEFNGEVFGKFCSCECGFTDIYVDDKKMFQKHLKSKSHQKFQLLKKNK